MKKLKNIDEIQVILKGIKNKNIVFTNGCFDILHSGHIKYLEISKNYGDILIIDKPAGLPTTPGGGFLKHTLVELLKSIT